MNDLSSTFRRRTVLVAALTPLACFGDLTARAAEPTLESSEDEFEAALESYQRGHWAAAFAAFARLADRGHVQAARIALQMLRYGPQLYGHTFSAPDGAAERWARAMLVRPVAGA